GDPLQVRFPSVLLQPLGHLSVQVESTVYRRAETRSTVNVALFLGFVFAFPAVPAFRWRAASGIQGVERLALRVDADVRSNAPASGATGVRRSVPARDRARPFP